MSYGSGGLSIQEKALEISISPILQKNISFNVSGPQVAPNSRNDPVTFFSSLFWYFALLMLSVARFAWKQPNTVMLLPSHFSVCCSWDQTNNASLSKHNELNFWQKVIFLFCLTREYCSERVLLWLRACRVSWSEGIVTITVHFNAVVPAPFRTSCNSLHAISGLFPSVFA